MTVPASSGKMPDMQCSSVDLPEPEGPMMATWLPVGIVRFTELSARTGVPISEEKVLTASVTLNSLVFMQLKLGACGRKLIAHASELQPWAN